MSLEATMILIDNSDWSRNGDFPPNRWDAQIEAVQLIQNAKLNAHAESIVGIMTMGNTQVDVLATPTNDEAKIMASLYGVQIGGKIHFSNALKIAQLVLKHRLNLSQRQRIVAFIASPIEESEAALINLAKRFKKNNIAVDIINLGQVDGNHIQKLQKFVDNCNKEDNSHFMNINPGINLLQDSLIGTPILGNMQGGQEGAGFNELGIDPNTDPELAQALRISLEEEKERVRQQEQKKQTEQQQQQNNQNQMVPEQPVVVENNQQQQQQPPQQSTNVQQQTQQPIQQEQKQQQQQQQQQQPQNMEEELDEEELLKRAKELSLQEGPQLQNVSDPAKEKKKEQQQQLFQDADFVNELMSMIPGMDQNLQDQLSGQMQDESKDKNQNDQQKQNDNNNNKK